VSTLNGSGRWWSAPRGRRRCSRPARSGEARVSLLSTATTSSSRKAFDITLFTAPAEQPRRCRHRVVVVVVVVVSEWILPIPDSAASFQRPGRQMCDGGRWGSVPCRSTVVKPGVWKTNAAIEESIVRRRSHSCSGRHRSADGRLVVSVGDILVPVRRRPLSHWRTQTAPSCRRQLVQDRPGAETRDWREPQSSRPVPVNNTRTCRVAVAGLLFRSPPGLRLHKPQTGFERRWMTVALVLPVYDGNRQLAPVRFLWARSRTSSSFLHQSANDVRRRACSPMYGVYRRAICAARSLV